MSQFIGVELRPSSGDLTAASTLTVPVPAGTAAGDIIVATCGYIRGSSESTAGPADMTGWTELTNSRVLADYVGGAIPTAYARVAGASETSYDFTQVVNGSDRDAVVALSVFRGVSITGYARNTSQGGSAAVVFPAASTAGKTGIAVRWWCDDTNSEAVLGTLPGLTFIAQGGNPAFQELFYETHSVSTNVPAYDTELASSSTSSNETLFFPDAESQTPTARKGSQFTVANTIGLVTLATLNGNAIRVDSQTSNTVTLTDTGSGITTSGAYNLVLTDDTQATETISVQVNVYGVVPSHNPVQKDGAAQASLTGIQLMVTANTSLNAAQYYYTSSATTDASGNLSTIDVSSSSASDGEAVLLHIRTAAGDSISATEAVELI